MTKGPHRQVVGDLNTRLATLGKAMPGIWQQVQIMRDSRGKDLPQWPNWCFLPMAGWLSIVSHQNGRHLIPNSEDSQAMPLVAALGTWRYTQGIYEFDGDLLTSLTDSIVTGELPTDVLLRLPEWCLYFALPSGGGYFVHLEWDANTERTELRFLVDSPAFYSEPFPLIMHIGPWTVTEAFERSIHESRLIAQSMRSSDFPEFSSNVIEHGASLLHRLLPPVLYLCSDEPDLSGEEAGLRPGNPQMTKTKQGPKLFAPPRPRVWKVGQTIGDTLRQQGHSSEFQGRRAHVRRAHWHGYWVGPRDGERTFKYHWIPPVMVRSSESTDTAKKSNGEAA